MICVISHILPSWVVFWKVQHRIVAFNLGGLGCRLFLFVGAREAGEGKGARKKGKIEERPVLWVVARKCAGGSFAKPATSTSVLTTKTSLGGTPGLVDNLQ